MDGKELFLMIEAISNEKNITKEDVLESLEGLMLEISSINMPSLIGFIGIL